MKEIFFSARLYKQSQCCDPQHASAEDYRTCHWSRLLEIEHSDAMSSVGSTGRSTGQHQSSKQPSGPTTVQTDYQCSSYVISLTPLPLSPPPDDQQGLACSSWNILAGVAKDLLSPGVAQTPNCLTLFCQEAVREHAERKGVRPKTGPVDERGQKSSMCMS